MAGWRDKLDPDKLLASAKQEGKDSYNGGVKQIEWHLKGRNDTIGCSRLFLNPDEESPIVALLIVNSSEGGMWIEALARSRSDNAIDFMESDHAQQKAAKLQKQLKSEKIFSNFSPCSVFTHMQLKEHHIKATGYAFHLFSEVYGPDARERYGYGPKGLEELVKDTNRDVKNVLSKLEKSELVSKDPEIREALVEAICHHFVSFDVSRDFNSNSYLR